MIHDFPEELLTEHDLVLKLAGQRVLSRVPRIPDSCLAHEIESDAMNHGSTLALRIGPEEDRRPEDPLERAHEPAILCSTLLHAERVQHLRRAPETNHATPLFDRQRGEKNRHEPVLTPGQPVCRMAGDLKKKLPVPPLM